MKISVAVVVWVLFCGIEAVLASYRETCESPFTSAPIPYEAAIGKVDVLGNDGLYPGSRRNHDRVYEIVVSDYTTGIPFINGELNGEELHHPLKSVQFELIFYGYVNGIGIDVKATFGYHYCDLIVEAHIKSIPPNTGTVNSELKNYITTTDFVTQEITQHNIKWIEDAFGSNQPISSTIKDGRWVRESTGANTLFAYKDDIKLLARKFGSG